MTILDFVQSLQDMKKAQTQWAAVDLGQRAEALRLISQKISGKAEAIANLLSDLESLPKNFVLQNEVEASQNYFEATSQVSVPSGILPKPTGFISIVLSEPMNFRILSEKLAPALLAGNGVFVYLPESCAAIRNLWLEILDPAWPVRIFTGGDDLADIMVSHPGIHAVAGFGSPEMADRILKLLAGTWKKSQITAGYHNSALILNDVNLPQVAVSLAQSCFVGMGRLHWNISNILVTEAQLPDFQQEFISQIQKLPSSPLPEKAQQSLDAIRAKLKSENGKILFDGGSQGPLVVQDLSHCSTLQQDCLMAPVVLISPVKYVHEMVRWTNTSYYGLLAQIFGPDEKVQKFAGQLEVNRVIANGWIEKMTDLPLGLKQSFSGLSDVNPFGGFYSDLRKIDGLESKS